MKNTPQFVEARRSGRGHPSHLRPGPWLGASLTLAVWLIAGVRAAPAAEWNLLRSTLVATNGLNFASGDQTRYANNINGRSYQQQNAVTTFNGWQYTIYYNSARRVCVGRRRLPAGNWEILQFTDYHKSGYDSHNVATLGVCAGDGTLHLAYDHHGSSLHYRRSMPGVATNPGAMVWGAGLFGPTTNRLGSIGPVSGVTYPRFFNAPNGNLMLYYRSGGSGDGDGMIQEYNSIAHTWTPGLGKFITRDGIYDGVLTPNSATRNPYLNGIFYGGNRLHVSWCWREDKDGGANNHDLCYAYSDDHGRTWRNSAGAVIGTTGSSFIHVNSPGLVAVSIPQNQDLPNQCGQYAYPDGRCHVMVERNGKYLHCWRTAGGVWNSALLGFGGDRPKLVGDADGRLFLVYVSGGTLRIARGMPNAGQTAWTWSTIHTRSTPREDGEGLLDLARWETERVLSIYGQEEPATVLDYGSGTPIEGLPSPVHVLDYQVSTAAILPNPPHGAVAVDPGANLQWTAGINAVAHRLYLGTNLAVVTAATTSSPEYVGQQTAASYQPGAPLAAGTTCFWRLDEVQSGGAVILGMVWQFTTTNATPPPPPTGGLMPGHAADTDVRSDLALITATGTSLIPGGSGAAPAKNRASVFVFQLPDLGAVVNPFTSAALTVHLGAIENTPPNADLYGLGRRANPEVLTGDYYGETAVVDDTDASLLQDNILAPDLAPGSITSSAAGGAALVSYLNTQYAAGAGIGHYVFLRFSIDASIGGTIKRYSLTSADAGAAGPPDTRPRIDFLTLSGNTPPVLTAISNQTLMAGQTLTITNTAADSDVPPQAMTFSLLHPPVGAAITAHGGVFTWQPTIAQSPSTNIIQVRVADSGPASLSATNSFQVTVLRPGMPIVSAPVWSGEGFNFTISGDLGPDYIILASTNLTDWLPVGTREGMAPPFLFSDDMAGQFGRRFYRVLLGP